jgi:tetratricopeptide (TPR) repeat protein
MRKRSLAVNARLICWVLFFIGSPLYAYQVGDMANAGNIDYVEASDTLEVAYQTEDSSDDAIAKFTVAIRLNRNDATAWYGRAVAYTERKAYDNAIADYTEAIRLNPKYAEAYFGRGIAYGGNGDFDKAKAEEDFAQAKKLGFVGGK